MYYFVLSTIAEGIVLSSNEYIFELLDPLYFSITDELINDKNKLDLVKTRIFNLYRNRYQTSLPVTQILIVDAKRGEYIWDYNVIDSLHRTREIENTYSNKIDFSLNNEYISLFNNCCKKVIVLSQLDMIRLIESDILNTSFKDIINNMAHCMANNLRRG